MPVANAALDALTAARPGFPRRANGRNKEEGRFKITVDGRNPASVDMVKISHYLQGFSTIPSGCFGFLNHQQYHCRKPIGPKFATLFGRINSSTCHVHSLHLYVPTGLSQLHILEYSHPTFLIGNPYTWYINPYGIGLMNIPYYMEPIESLDPIAHMDTCRHRAKQIWGQLTLARQVVPGCGFKKSACQMGMTFLRGSWNMTSSQTIHFFAGEIVWK